MNATYYTGKETIENGECKTLSPGPDEVKIKVAYCGICGTDMHIFHGKMDQRVDMPQVIGHEASGTVVELGENVKNLCVGQKVAVMPLDWCGECPACKDGHTHICHNLKFLGIDTPGAFQEYWTVPARVALPLVDSQDLKIAALTEPLAVALHDVRIGEVKENDFVVIVGGGPIGALIAMAAKRKGARVLVSEINEYRLEMFQGLDIESVNPLERDLEKLVLEKTAERGADVVFEVSSRQEGIDAAVQLLKTRGLLVCVGIFSEPPKLNLLRYFLRELRLCGVRVYEKQDYEEAIKIMAGNSLPVSKLVSEVFPLSDLERGIRELEKGGKMMKILIQCSEEEA
jgi:2-desacetyl-2-hydroxyethyl bacteriochlorophyllide A dehydrogenase